jgi:ATP-dependent exoDNAse (exonuclease V) alpha subunit
VLGLPVLVSQNFDVEGGIVNGSRGTVSRIRYCIDDDGHRHLISVIVHINDSSEECIYQLPPHKLPILADSSDIMFEHPFSKKRCCIQRKQVPILPVFAMTAHRAQGQTLNTVIIDLQSCKGTEAPYVMASRARCLDGLLILRPFDRRKISCRESEDARKEKQRLKILNLATLQKFGNESEK